MMRRRRKKCSFLQQPLYNDNHNNITALLLLLLLSIRTTTTTAFFIATPKTKIITKSYSTDNKSLVLLSATKGQRQNKKRRFGQDVHTPRRTNNYDNNDDNGSSFAYPKRRSPSPQQQQRRKNDSYQPGGTRRPPPPRRRQPPQNNDLMWKTNKSIKDLEASMTKRWGTGPSSSMDDDEDEDDDDDSWEIVEDDDDDDDEDEAFVYQEDNNAKSRAVFDPWQKAEYKQQQKEKREQRRRERKEQRASNKNNNNLFPQETQSTKNDRIIRRVKRNQERLQQKQPKQQQQQRKDFYDEDDEGYEVNRYNNRNNDYDDTIDKLLAPQPVGGKGYFDEDNDDDYDDDNYNDNRSSSGGGGGYFLNPNAAQMMEEEERKNLEVLERKQAKKEKKKLEEEERQRLQEEEEARAAAAEEGEEPTTSKSRRRPKRVPLLDENGNSLYLTLEQAEKNFRAMTSNSEEELENFENDVEEDEVIGWNELGVTSPQLLSNLESQGCSFPLHVQQQCCPAILTGNDVLVGTYTGSGKTLAFLVPLIQRLLLDDSSSGKGVQVVIVAPGRELASQITSVARSLLQDLSSDKKLKVVMAIGGTTFKRNLEEIRKKKPAIVVGTPGRIAELIVGQPGAKGGRMKVSDLKSIVLDEFDALLQYKAHRDPTKALFSFLRRRHRDTLQSIMCSATATDMMATEEEGEENDETEEDDDDYDDFYDDFYTPKKEKPSNVYQEYLRQGKNRVTTVLADENDKLVTARTAATRVSRTVLHGVMHVPRRQLILDTIRRILHTDPMPQQVLIFCDSSRSVDMLVKRLAEIDIIAAALHGGVENDKNDRAEVSRALRGGYVGLVVATEMAARGLDAPLLTHVINLDLPTDASHYAHRAGRCGRGGRPGVVLNLTTCARERKVPQKFTDALGVDLYTVQAHGGKLQLVVDEEQQQQQQ